MARLWGRDWSRQDLLAHVGDLSQVGGVHLAKLSDGAERGVRIADFRSGSGLRFAVQIDRGLNLGPAEYRGIPLAWLSPAGFAHPAFYEPQGLGWLRTFGGGLMAGCGLTNVGSPNVDEGEELGQHGRLSTLPASQVQVGERWEGDECIFWLQGQVRQARLFGENLRLTRHISLGLGRSTISLRDTVENLGAERSPLMLLYHINLGFPLLDESSRLEATPHAVRARDADADAGMADWARFQPPTPGYREQVFYHDLPAGQGGWAEITLASPSTGLRCAVRFQKAGLPNLIQWKMMGRGAYVLGLEPANCLVEGRNQERARGTLQFIEPGERREFAVQIEIEESSRG